MKTEQEIIEINKKQKEYYNEFKSNTTTKLWTYLRDIVLKKIRNNIGVVDQIYDQHKTWFGDLSTKKVLDLGCYSGNHLTMYLAQNAKEYVGIDLSDVAIAKLQKSLEKYPNANALAVDFLSETDFPDKDFDLIYAYGVLHHFQNTDLLIEKLNEKLAYNGTIISHDPLETSLPVKIARVLYRPFQTDKDWEWPFTKSTYYKFQNSFKIIDRHGVLGKSKWTFFVNFLPISEVKKQSIGKKWHNSDWENSTHSDTSLFSCMQLSMLMQKK